MDDPSICKVVKGVDGYQLLVNDEPFFINGAGLEFGSIPKLAAHGANAFRTWRVDNAERTGKEVLDEAHAHGLKVMMGIEVARERHGFDYDDPVAVAAQLEQIKADVLALKDHPALIIWGIGNELNLQATNPKVWDAVNEISRMIHEVDPHHPTTTSLAGLDQQLADYISERAPDVDLLSIQLYGTLPDLPGILKEVDWQGPIMVTEWGATGYWEAKKTNWNIPLEDTSSVKADHYLKRHESILEMKGQCVGSFVFLWGQKQERTSTWFGMHTIDGRATEVVMHYLWNGEWPKVSCPRVKALTLDDRSANQSVVLKPGERYEAKLLLDRSVNITYRWEVLYESEATEEGGDDEQVPERIDGLIDDATEAKIRLSAPMQEGKYRLYVYANDAFDHTAHANIPFLVK